LQGLLTTAGFRVESATYRLAPLYPAIALVRTLRGRAVLAADAVPDSDVWLPPALINAALTLVGRLDNAVVRSVGWPFGSSVFAVARRPD
jgi:hypothetical protein